MYSSQSERKVNGPSLFVFVHSAKMLHESFVFVEFLFIRLSSTKIICLFWEEQYLTKKITATTTTKNLGTRGEIQKPTMDLLAGIIGGGPVTVDVTVNGMPLSTLVAQIALTLKEQQNQIAELRDYTFKNDEQMWGRITSLEGGVDRLNRDLGFDQRTEKGTLQSKPTHEAISTLEKDVALLDRKRKGMVMRQTQDWNEKRLLRARYFTWLNVTKRNSALRLLTGLNTREVQARYLRKWLLWRSQEKRRKVRASAVEVLQRFNGNRLKRHYYEKWIQWRDVSMRYKAERHVALVRAVDSMAAVSVRGFIRRKWLQWIQVVARRRLREDQKRTALRMAALSSRQLVRRYFATWLALEGHHNLRRRQLRTATALAVQSSRILAGQKFALWVALGRRKKQRRTGAALIPRMAHDQSVRLASRYYIKLWRNAMSRRDERSRSQLEDMTRDLTRRFENLSGQVSGTMTQSLETVTALQKLSQAQVALEQRALGGAGTGPQPLSASGLIRQATPPHRRPSPPVRSASSNLQQLAEQRSPVPSRDTTAVRSTVAIPSYIQSGQDKPSAQAMQLGSQVSQINLRGGGSGELSRVRTVPAAGNVTTTTATTSSGAGGINATRTGSQQPQLQQQQQMPAQWLESPDAAWNAMRERLLQSSAKK